MLYVRSSVEWADSIRNVNRSRGSQDIVSMMTPQDINI